MSSTPRFFVPPERIAGGRVSLEPAQARQAVRVLRLRPGARIQVLDGAGNLFTVVMERLTVQRGEGSIIAQEEAPGEPRVRIALCQALLKGPKFELALQKGTELGAAAFLPLLCQRCEPGVPTPQRLARWRHIIREAAEQSGRGLLPALLPPATIRQALETLEGPSLLLWEGQGARSLRAGLGGLKPRLAEQPRLSLLIGPEGGFTPQEASLAQEGGALLVTLGPRVLRAETAGIAALAAALYELGEMSR